MSVTKPSKSQELRRKRMLQRESTREANYDRTLSLNHHQTRWLGQQPRVTPDDPLEYKPFHVQYRYCGALELWVGYAYEHNTWEVRVAGYPTVSDIAMRVRNPGSSKSFTRAARYALLFLEQQLGAPVFGALKDGDSYVVEVTSRHALPG